MREASGLLREWLDSVRKIGVPPLPQSRCGRSRCTVAPFPSMQTHNDRLASSTSRTCYASPGVLPVGCQVMNSVTSTNQAPQVVTPWGPIPQDPHNRFGWFECLMAAYACFLPLAPDPISRDTVKPLLADENGAHFTGFIDPVALSVVALPSRTTVGIALLS